MNLLKGGMRNMSDNPQIIPGKDSYFNIYPNKQEDTPIVEDMVKQQLSSQCLQCIGPENRHYEGYWVDPIQKMEDEIGEMILVECKNCSNKWWGRI